MGILKKKHELLKGFSVTFIPLNSRQFYQTMEKWYKRHKRDGFAPKKRSWPNLHPGCWFVNFQILGGFQGLKSLDTEMWVLTHVKNESQ